LSHEENQALLRLFMGRPWPDFELHGQNVPKRRELHQMGLGPCWLGPLCSCVRTKERGNRKKGKKEEKEGKMWKNFQN
jgi:hypothetical protein